jgi:membrane peptidoglycan carboxypeptidase
VSRILRRLGLAALVALAAVSCACGALYGSLPSTGDAVARVEQILRAHGARFAAIPDGTRVSRAVVAVEDQRFFDHGAIDPVAVGRVLVDSVAHPGSDPGGSTIAQQLAKTLYVRDPGSLIGRLQAIGLAFKLEHELSRPRILQLYLNAIFFGHGAYGVGQAARSYFHRAPAQLSWRQAALLAGLPQAPSAYDPVAHPALAWQRRREVLRRLAATAVLPSAQAIRLVRAPLGIT